MRKGKWSFFVKRIKTTDQEMKPSHRNKENAINHEVSSQIKSPYQIVKSKSTSALLPDEESTSKQIITVNHFSSYYGCTSSLGFGINVIWLIHITQKSFFQTCTDVLVFIYLSVYCINVHAAGGKSATLAMMPHTSRVTHQWFLDHFSTAEEHVARLFNSCW